MSAQDDPQAPVMEAVGQKLLERGDDPQKVARTVVGLRLAHEATHHPSILPDPVRSGCPFCANAPTSTLRWV